MVSGPTRSIQRSHSALGDAIEDRTELVVAIPDDELRALLERRRIAQLLRRPRLRRSTRHRNVDDAPGVHVDDEERKDRTEPDIVGLQEIAGPHRGFARMSASAVRCAEHWVAHIACTFGPFALRRGCRASRVRRECARLPKAGSRPPCVDEGDDVRSDARVAWTVRAAYSTREETESRAVPSKHSLGFDQEQGVAPMRNQSREQDEQAALMASKAGALDAA